MQEIKTQTKRSKPRQIPKIKTKARRSNQSQGDQTKVKEIKQRRSKEALCLLGLWGWEEIRVPSSTRHLTSSTSTSSCTTSRSYSQNTFLSGKQHFQLKLFSFKLLLIFSILSPDPSASGSQSEISCFSAFWEVKKFAQQSLTTTSLKCKSRWWYTGDSTDVKCDQKGNMKGFLISEQLNSRFYKWCVLIVLILHSILFSIWMMLNSKLYCIHNENADQL